MSPETEQTEDFVSLYRRAFDEYGASALWSSRPVPKLTCEDALAITRSLRVEGDLSARRLARYTEADFRRVTSDPPVDAQSAASGRNYPRPVP
jgi:hypothetical protein